MGATDNAGNANTPLSAELHIGGGTDAVTLVTVPSAARRSADAPAAAAAAGAVVVAVVLWLLLR